MRLAMAASAAGGDGSAACLPPRVTRGAQWPSKLALLSAVASLSETLGRSVRVAKSDRSRVIVKCMSRGCDFHVSAKAVNDGEAWAVVRVRACHSCASASKRARNYRADLVMHSAGAAARGFVPVMGRQGGGVRQLCATVAGSGGHLVLSEGQARRHIQQLFGATDTDFVMQLQLLDDYLRQMREQDPEGKVHGDCCVRWWSVDAGHGRRLWSGL